MFIDKVDFIQQTNSIIRDYIANTIKRNQQNLEKIKSLLFLGVSEFILSEELKLIIGKTTTLNQNSRSINKTLHRIVFLLSKEKATRYEFEEFARSMISSRNYFLHKASVQSIIIRKDLLRRDALKYGFHKKWHIDVIELTLKKLFGSCEIIIEEVEKNLATDDMFVFYRIYAEKGKESAMIQKLGKENIINEDWFYSRIKKENINESEKTIEFVVPLHYIQLQIYQMEIKYAVADFLSKHIYHKKTKIGLHIEGIDDIVDKKDEIFLTCVRASYWDKEEECFERDIEVDGFTIFM